MTDPRLSVAQLTKACEQNKYLIARFTDGYSLGLNCAYALISLKSLADNELTEVMSYRPCSFNEYISRKTPFL